jgi:hypothetical protein
VPWDRLPPSILAQGPTFQSVSAPASVASPTSAHLDVGCGLTSGARGRGNVPMGNPAELVGEATFAFPTSGVLVAGSSSHRSSDQGP